MIARRDYVWAQTKRASAVVSQTGIICFKQEKSLNDTPSISPISQTLIAISRRGRFEIKNIMRWKFLDNEPLCMMA
jgi:hypothetical protein